MEDVSAALTLPVIWKAMELCAGDTKNFLAHLATTPKYFRLESELLMTFLMVPSSGIGMWSMKPVNLPTTFWKPRTAGTRGRGQAW